jgi:urease accessory protein
VNLLARLGQRHSARETACAFVWGWLENQTLCACKCLSLGQSAVQHILLDIMPHIPKILDRAALRQDAEVGSSLPGLAIASAGHERQYGRMFRS